MPTLIGAHADPPLGDGLQEDVEGAVELGLAMTTGGATVSDSPRGPDCSTMTPRRSARTVAACAMRRVESSAPHQAAAADPPHAARRLRETARDALADARPRCAARRAARISSRLASAAAQPIGLPRYVDVCSASPRRGRPRVRRRRRVATAADTGSPPHRFADAHDVGYDAVVRAGEPRAGAAEARVDLVERQQRSALVADAAQTRAESRPAARRRPPCPGPARRRRQPIDASRASAASTAASARSAAPSTSRSGNATNDVASRELREERRPEAFDAGRPRARRARGRGTRLRTRARWGGRSRAARSSVRTRRLPRR